jgi:hypothetical protein
MPRNPVTPGGRLSWILASRALAVIGRFTEDAARCERRRHGRARHGNRDFCKSQMNDNPSPASEFDRPVF